MSEAQERQSDRSVTDGSLLDMDVEKLRAPVSPVVRASAYASATLAWAFALLSLIWASGGTVGVGTLGGAIEDMARRGDPAIMIANVVAVFAKVAVGLVALALVQPWGARLPQQLLRRVALSVSALLIVYGMLQETGVLLALTGVVEPTAGHDRSVLYWRLFLWEPWFLAWGVTLAVPSVAFARAARIRRAAATHVGNVGGR